MSRELTGWGRYPSVTATIARPDGEREAADLVTAASVRPAPDADSLVARGLGRSYGDSSLAELVVDLTGHDRFIAFDPDEGLLRCAAGVSLAEILQVFVPRGWFLPTSPGTKFVTVGGAVASDVHGKNHHVDGTFGDHVTSMRVATVSDGVVTCSRTERPDLFHATCGGMGLTGIILDVTFRLRPIDSAHIDQTVHRARDLDEALELFLRYRAAPYSVAWIDCLARGRSLGRSLLSVGRHAPDGGLRAGGDPVISVPVDLPSIVLNRHSVRAFNALYYHRVRRPGTEQRVHYEPFFYPLDGIHHWNRIYGRQGFAQYQFVVPERGGLGALRRVLEVVAASGRASFLAVLKAFGPANDNHLSFPLEGYTLALDLKYDDGLHPFLDRLDDIVLSSGGRLYLSKDGRMSPETFRAGYPRWSEWLDVRRRYRADEVLHSRQSQRLGI